MENVKFVVALRQPKHYWDVARFEFNTLEGAQYCAKLLLTHQITDEDNEPFEVVISMEKIVLTANEESEDE